MSSATPGRRPVPELEAEQELEFGRYGRAIVARWWLLPVGLVVGVVIGILVRTGGGRPYSATTTIYLGAPTIPGSNGTPTQSLSTRFNFATHIATSRATLAEVTAKLGLPRGSLDGRVTVTPVPGIPNARSTEAPAPIVAITVDHLPAKKEVDAANAIAAVVVRSASSYVDQRLATYAKRLQHVNERLATVDATLNDAQKSYKSLLNNRSIPPTEKLLLLANLNNVINVNTTRQANLESTQLSYGDVVAFAQQVEKARVFEAAVPHKASPQSRRNSAAIGGLVGLILGILAALFWEPVANARRAARTSS